MELSKKKFELIFNHLSYLVRVYWIAETGRSLLEERPVLFSQTKWAIIKSLYPQFIIGISALLEAKESKGNHNFSLQLFIPESFDFLSNRDVVRNLRSTRNKILVHRDLESFSDVGAFISANPISRTDAWNILDDAITLLASKAEETIPDFSASFVTRKLKEEIPSESKKEAELLFKLEK